MSSRFYVFDETLTSIIYRHVQIDIHRALKIIMVDTTVRDADLTSTMLLFVPSLLMVNDQSSPIEQECPTLWRFYDYHTTKERDSILRARSSKKKLRLGNGGEAYIANDEWCYNCGQQGHWGDVSINFNEIRRTYLTSGPFIATGLQCTATYRECTE